MLNTSETADSDNDTEATRNDKASGSLEGAMSSRFSSCSQFLELDTECADKDRSLGRPMKSYEQPLNSNSAISDLRQKEQAAGLQDTIRQ